MKQKQKRILACAVALALGSILPNFAYAAPEDATEIQKLPKEEAAAQANAAKVDARVDKEAKSLENTPGKQASSASAEKKTTHQENAAGSKAPKEDITAEAERAAQWAKTRPQEDDIQSLEKAMNGLTIVDIVYDGASEKTLGTAKMATHMKPGDKLTIRALQADRDYIYDTGYFYDIYPTFEKVPEGVVLTYHLLENPILKSVKITGNVSESDDTLYSLMTVRTGTILNNRILHENVTALQDQYKKDGYILAKVSDMNIDNEGNLLLKINEGILEGYAVKGNKKTRDKVILREMRQKPGTPFNSKLAKRSIQRVYNLGFFNDVNLKMNPGVEPNSVVMEVDVDEKRTGNFGVGAGYSTSDGFIGMVSVGDTNFRGTGDAINFSYAVSGDDKDARGYIFSYRHPWIDHHETVGTLRIYNRTYEYDDYDEHGKLNETYMRKYSGGEVTFGRPASEYSTNYITLRSRKDQYVKHVDSGRNNRSKAWREENFGRTNSVTLQHVTDTRDNVYNPTEGGRIALTAEIAGFGGDFDFQKFSIEDQRYFKVGHAQVVAVRGMAGVGTGDMSYFNKFRLGGQTTLRGYREDQFRGRKMGLLSAEYRFPIAKQVQGAIFTDWGAAWDDDYWPDTFKGSVGVGVSLNTPLGPLRLDYGRGSDGGRIHFSVGGSF